MLNSPFTSSQWINDAYNYWDELRLAQEGANAGITQLSGYQFSSTHQEIVRVGITVKNYRLDIIEDVFYLFRIATSKT